MNANNPGAGSTSTGGAVPPYPMGKTAVKNQRKKYMGATITNEDPICRKYGRIYRLSSSGNLGRTVSTGERVFNLKTLFLLSLAPLIGTLAQCDWEIIRDCVPHDDGGTPVTILAPQCSMADRRGDVVRQKPLHHWQCTLRNNDEGIRLTANFFRLGSDSDDIYARGTSNAEDVYARGTPIHVAERTARPFLLYEGYPYLGYRNPITGELSYSLSTKWVTTTNEDGVTLFYHDLLQAQCTYVDSPRISSPTGQKATISASALCHSNSENRNKDLGDSLTLSFVAVLGSLVSDPYYYLTCPPGYAVEEVRCGRNEDAEDNFIDRYVRSVGAVATILDTLEKPKFYETTEYIAYTSGFCNLATGGSHGYRFRMEVDCAPLYMEGDTPSDGYCWRTYSNKTGSKC